MKKHKHYWKVSCFNCPSCGGLFKYCIGKIHSGKSCNKYICGSKKFCRDRDLHKRKSPVYYKFLRVDNIIKFERS